MEPTHVIDWSTEALRMTLVLGGPLLAAALLVGLSGQHRPDPDSIA